MAARGHKRVGTLAEGGFKKCSKIDKCINPNKGIGGFLKIEEFGRDKSRIDGFLTWCKPCLKAVRLANKKTIQLGLKRYYVKNKESITLSTKAYALKNKVKIRLRKKRYYLKNKEKIKLQSSAYRSIQFNKDKFRKYFNEYSKKRRESDLNFKLRGIIRSRFWLALKASQCGKKVSAVKGLSCSMEFFIRYIESLWEPWMNWDNYGNKPGNWSFDHIIALANFNLMSPEEQKKACHYTNYRPLLHLDNIKKGCR